MQQVSFLFAFNPDILPRRREEGGRERWRRKEVLRTCRL